MAHEPHRAKAIGSAFAGTLCLLATIPASAASPTDLRAWELALRERRFSGVVSVRQGAETVFEYADNGANPGRRDIRSSDVFWIGSVSKQFAAVAVLRLASQGRVALDAPVSRYLPLRDGALTLGGKTCTLEHLLSSTCGLPEGSKVCDDVDLSLPDNRRRYLDCAGSLQLEFEPGARHQYANLGFGLAGLVVEAVAGTSYEELLRRELLDPIGMPATGVALGRRGALVERLAPGELDLGTTSLEASRWLRLDPLGPGRRGASGNVYSTVEDLHAWNQALHTGRVLDPERYGELVRVRHDDYGLGLVTRRTHGVTWYWHNGGLTPMGYSAFVAYVPTKDLSVVVLANRGPETSLMDPVGGGLVSSALGGKPPSLRPPSDESFAVGVIFAVLPPLVGLSLVAQLVLFVRGPRKTLTGWLSGMITCLGAALVGVGILDFYGDHRWALAALATLPAVALLVHRRRWRGELASAGALAAEKRGAIWASVISIALLCSMRGAPRLWLAAALAAVLLPIGRHLLSSRVTPHAPRGAQDGS